MLQESRPKTSTQFRKHPSHVSVEGNERMTINIDMRLPLAPEVGRRTSTGSSDRSSASTPEPPQQDQFGKPASKASCSEELFISTGRNGTFEYTTKNLNSAFDGTLNAIEVRETAGGKCGDVATLTGGVRDAPPVAVNDRRSFGRNTSFVLGSLFPTETRVEPAACNDNDDDDWEATPTKLNGTFNKTPSDSSPLNRTFEKEGLILPFVDNISTWPRTPVLDPRLDFTVQTEEMHGQQSEPCKLVTEENLPGSPDAMALHGAPEMHEIAGRTQSTPQAVPEKLFVPTPGDDPATIGNRLADHEDSEPEATNGAEQAQAPKPEMKRRASDLLLKRHSDNLELSFVSSTKRSDCHKNSPSDRHSISGTSSSDLINLHESLAFDFCAAAATAETNNGVADIGSFILANPSGQPVPPDVFDLSALGRLHTDTGTKSPGDHKYTRVSFIAMFDPIKPGRPVCHDDASNKTAPHNEGEANLLVDVDGVRLPASAALCFQTVAVQTEPLPEDLSITRRESLSPHDTIDYDEISGRIENLNSIMTRQRLALSTHATVTSLLRSRMVAWQQENRSNETDLGQTDQDAKVALLKESLASKLERNRQQDEVIRNLEQSLHLTLRRMAECRKSNAALAEVVEEQLPEIAATRAHCEAKALNMSEILTREEEEKRALQEKCQANERSHNKAMELIRLQLQAKESELESTYSQLVIAKKEIESLRELVKQFNCQ